MSELLNGPVGNIVGSAINVVLSNSPLGASGLKVVNTLRDCVISTRSEQTHSKFTEQNKEDNVYDNVEQHLKGALKILKPAIEITRLIKNECRSVDRELTARPKTMPLQYYTPQKQPKSHTCTCSAQIPKSRHLQLRDYPKPSIHEKMEIKHDCHSLNYDKERIKSLNENSLKQNNIKRNICGIN